MRSSARGELACPKSFAVHVVTVKLNFHSRLATMNGVLSLLSLRCDESSCESLLSKPLGL